MISICVWRFNHTSTDFGKLFVDPFRNATRVANELYSQAFINDNLSHCMVRSFRRGSV
jgi:hypothetical protein